MQPKNHEWAVNKQKTTHNPKDWSAQYWRKNEKFISENYNSSFSSYPVTTINGEGIHGSISSRYG